MTTTKKPSRSLNGTMKDLGPNDVLLGRGTGPNEQIGNIRFRALVRKSIQAFGLKDLDGKSKAKLAREVTEQVKARGGRFVKKAEFVRAKSSLDSTAPGAKIVDRFEEVDDSVALDKVKQSFRHQLRAMMPGGDTKDESQQHRRAASKIPDSIILPDGTMTIPSPILIPPSSPTTVLKSSSYLADGISNLRHQQAGLVASSSLNHSNTILNSFPALGNPISLSMSRQSSSSSIAAGLEGLALQELASLYLAEARAKALFSHHHQHLVMHDGGGAHSCTPIYYPGASSTSPMMNHRHHHLLLSSCLGAAAGAAGGSHHNLRDLGASTALLEALLTVGADEFR